MFIAQKPMGAVWTAQTPTIDLTVFATDLWANQTENMALYTGVVMLVTILLALYVFNEPVAQAITAINKKGVKKALQGQSDIVE